MKLYTIKDVADEIDVVPKTIVRWEKAGRIDPIKRDYRGWRVFTEEEKAKIKAFRETTS